ncbi:MAG: ferritin [Erysipelotrichaceae bacterium]|jgi:ferritin|nr:ferritin [Erysipelotrichaceae bacterium]
MLSEKIVQLINAQITKEFYSAYLYLSMANYYEAEGLNGFENWMMIQAQEERDHALLFRQYLQENDAEVVLYPVAAPDAVFKERIDPLNKTLAHERTVTESIHAIYAQAFSEKDFRTMQFLDWFINEQREEEHNASDLIKWFGLYGSDAKGLYDLDAKLAARTYAAPTLVL